MTTMQAINIREPGGPEVLALTDWPVPVPTAHEVLIDVRAAGKNYHSTAVIVETPEGILTASICTLPFN